MEDFLKIKKCLVNVDGPYLCQQNDRNSLPRKTFGYIIDIYFNFFKKKKKVYSDFKYQAHKFSNKFDVGIFYVFKVGIIKITLKPFFVRRDFFPFKLMISNILQFFGCLHFCLNLHNVFPFFPNKNCQIL